MGLLRLNQLAWITTLVIITLHLWWNNSSKGLWIYQAYALFYLGLFQLVSSLLPFVFWKVVTKKSKQRIYLYWIGVLIYFGVSILFIISKEDQILSYDPTNFRILSILIAMLLGGYLVICLHRIKKAMKP